MKVQKYIGLILFSAMLMIKHPAVAQCAMCTLNAENSVKNGQTEGRGLNRAILFLLAAPYVAVTGIGFLWYKKYRRKNIDLHIKNDKISLN